RFITTIGITTSTDEFKQFLQVVRAEMPDATHHVYAFRVGYGNSVIEGMSDDGEPAGTAGPPTLSVLRGTDIGDITIITTRYFGGTKLGTGGLVRAYTESAQTGLSHLKTRLKIETLTVGIEIPYSLYEQVKRLIHASQGEINDETFTGKVVLIITFPVKVYDAFSADLAELSAGQIVPILFN
ncbi:MAG: YigZ family protein, partial [Anaerolineae bacterium]|nr:YigZ family protein [Anaerolineae bacterium]